MALLKSKNLGRNFSAPDFSLQGVNGLTYSLSDFKASRVLVVLFICNHCPYVKAIEDRLLETQREFAPYAVQFVAICSNNFVDYPDDTPAELFKRWEEKKYGFPYLVDETQDVAKAYGAVCTPDLYVFDSDRRLAYHGRLDDHWQEPLKVTQRDLADALRALLGGRTPSAEQFPSMGCSIKWHPSKA